MCSCDCCCWLLSCNEIDEHEGFIIIKLRIVHMNFQVAVFLFFGIINIFYSLVDCMRKYSPLQNLHSSSALWSDSFQHLNCAGKKYVALRYFSASLIDWCLLWCFFFLVWNCTKPISFTLISIKLFFLVSKSKTLFY